MYFAHLTAGIRQGLAQNHCALCGMALDSYLDEVPCPHWFVVPGWRGFRSDKLAKVFEVFDLHTVTQYLRVFAESRPAGDEAPAYQERVEEGATTMSGARPSAAISSAISRPTLPCHAIT